MAGVKQGEAEKRARIIAAARFLVLRHGLRATSMEAIAREAGMAKPTLYAVFGDKEAVFSAIVVELADLVRSQVAAALAGEGDVIARVGAAITAKHKVIARLLDGSPHAEELYGEHDRAVAPLFQALDAEISGRIADALQAAGVARARGLTQLLLAAAFGIGRKAKSVAELGPAIRLLTERLLRPELPD